MLRQTQANSRRCLRRAQTFAGEQCVHTHTFTKICILRVTRTPGRLLPTGLWQGRATARGACVSSQCVGVDAVRVLAPVLLFAPAISYIFNTSSETPQKEAPGIASRTPVLKGEGFWGWRGRRAPFSWKEEALRRCGGCGTHAIYSLDLGHLLELTIPRFCVPQASVHALPCTIKVRR